MSGSFKRPKITPQTKFDELPELLTVEETASYIGCTAWTVYQNISRGEIPHRRIGPKRLYVPKTFFASDVAQAAPLCGAVRT